jgi:hypothetical protein
MNKNQGFKGNFRRTKRDIMSNKRDATIIERYSYIDHHSL